MPINKERRDENDSLLKRVASALSTGELPTTEDSVSLEQLVWDYREHEGDPRDLGLRTRSDKRSNKDAVKDITLLTGCLVQRRECSESVYFVDRVRAYLRKVIPIAKLFGERNRSTQKEEYTLGWMAEQVHDEIRHSNGEKLSTKGANANKPGSLYTFLSEVQTESDKSLIERHDLDPDTDLNALRDFMASEQEADPFNKMPGTWKRYRTAFRRDRPTFRPHKTTFTWSGATFRRHGKTFRMDRPSFTWRRVTYMRYMTAFRQ